MPPLAMLLLVGASFALAGCRPSPRVGATEPSAARLEPASRPSGRIRVLARATAHSIATTKDSVLFGDAKKDALLAVSKSRGAPVLVGKHAPLDMSVLDSRVAWIGSPGDTVYWAPLGRGEVSVLVTNGRFTAIGGSGENVFLTKAAGDAYALVRLHGSSVASTTTLAFRPSHVLLDASDAFVLTDSELYGVPLEGGLLRLVVVGSELAGLALAEQSVLTTMGGLPSRVLLRAPKTGGRGETLAWGVREGPIAAWGGYVYFFDEVSPTLWRVPVVGGPPMPIARTALLGAVNALAVDESGIYVATDRTDEAGAGTILAIAHPR